MSQQTPTWNRFYTGAVWCALLFLLLQGRLYAEDWNLDAQGVVIQGYDTVAYFEQQEAVVGSAQYSVQWQGATWYFANERHRALFIASPQRYIPQFGGYCANGLSDGHKVSGKGKNWRIIDDKLYLFYSVWGRLQWAVDVENQLALATANWVLLKTPDK